MTLVKTFSGAFVSLLVANLEPVCNIHKDTLLSFLNLIFTTSNMLKNVTYIIIITYDRNWFTWILFVLYIYKYSKIKTDTRINMCVYIYIYIYISMLCKNEFSNQLYRWFDEETKKHNLLRAWTPMGGKSVSRDLLHDILTQCHDDHSKILQF